MSARLAVEEAFHCAAEHNGSVFVMERMDDSSVWEGIVEVLTIAEPPPHKVFAWLVMGKHGPEWLIVPETKESSSPALAVHNWIKENHH